jgi:hypothetical protein
VHIAYVKPWDSACMTQGDRIRVTQLIHAALLDVDPDYVWLPRKQLRIAIKGTFSQIRD